MSSRSNMSLKNIMRMRMVENYDIERSIKPNHSYQLYNHDLDSKPVVDFRTFANEVLLNEDPDDMTIDNESGDYLNWYEHKNKVVCVFSLLKNRKTGAPFNVAWGKYVRSPHGIYCNDKNAEDIIIKWIDDNLKGVESGFKHAYLMIPLTMNGYLDTYDRELQPGIKGRSWLHEGFLYTSFWNKRKEVIAHKSELADLFSHCKLKLEEGIYEFIDYQDEIMSYPVAFGNQSGPGSTPEDVIKALLKKQHLDPRAKKALHQLQNADADKLASLADNMGIPLIKLKHILGMEIAE